MNNIHFRRHKNNTCLVLYAENRIKMNAEELCTENSNFFEDDNILH